MEKNHYNIQFTPASILKLASHIEFLAQINENAAMSLYDSYEEAKEFLKSTPEICPKYYPDIVIDANLKYKLFGSRYRIVFEIIENIVYVQDIQDCRQDTDKNLI